MSDLKQNTAGRNISDELVETVARAMFKAKQDFVVIEGERLPEVVADNGDVLPKGLAFSSVGDFSAKSDAPGPALGNKTVRAINSLHQ